MKIKIALCLSVLLVQLTGCATSQLNDPKPHNTDDSFRQNDQHKHSLLNIDTKQGIVVEASEIYLCNTVQKFISGESINMDVYGAGVLNGYEGFLIGGVEYNPQNSILLFTKAMPENIISNINIGTLISDVKQSLAEPSLEYDGALMYYFKDFSVMFYGTQKVEYIGFILKQQVEFDFLDFENQLDKIDDTIDMRSLYLKYGGHLYISPGSVQILLLPYGIKINSFNDNVTVDIYLNSYYKWATHNNGHINYIDENFDLNSFISFCKIMNSNQWMPNTTNTLFAFVITECNNGKICIRDCDNDFKVVKTGYVPIEIEWLDNDILKFYTIPHNDLTAIYGPYFYDCINDVLTNADGIKDP